MLPPGCKTICYADDTLVLAGAASPIDLQCRINQAVGTIADWIQAADLDLAVEKLEATFTSKYRMENLRIVLRRKLSIA